MPTLGLILKWPLRLACLVAAALCTDAVWVSGQAPQFEAVSVKRQFQSSTTAPTLLPPNRFYRRSATVSQLIRYAFSLGTSQVSGGQNWIREYGFEIDATAPGNKSEEQLRLMVQALLRDRFKLVTHVEQREMRFAALTLVRADGRLGPDIKRCDLEQPPALSPVLVPRNGRVLLARCGDLSDVIGGAASMMMMPVIDRTGLQGSWTFHLRYTLPATAGGSDDPSSDAPFFGTALQEQLGMRVREQTGPVEILVIDSVSEPEPN